QRVFSGGDGTIYAIRPDGVLLRYIHKGYLDGSPDSGPAEEIGTGWGGFREVVAAANGVLYAFTRDGRILWYRYGKRPPLPPQQNPQPDTGIVTGPGNISDMVAGGGATQQGGGLGGLVTGYNPGVVLTRDDPNRLDVVTRPNEDTSLYVNPDIETWEGPVEIRRNLPAFRAVFVRMGEPFRGPN
ncbi:MAG TPA: tachylectin-related carbohydrate-binding protein, partial [Kiloniellales bacterium]|nr:tachylectin-related carbohydrate-binding protein [Kiloniellales bacterium]